MWGCFPSGQLVGPGGILTLLLSSSLGMSSVSSFLAFFMGFIAMSLWSRDTRVRYEPRRFCLLCVLYVICFYSFTYLSFPWLFHNLACATRGSWLMECLLHTGKSNMMPLSRKSVRFCVLIFHKRFTFGGECSESPDCCLLYTSPSPRDRQKSRMPSSA